MTRSLRPLLLGALLFLAASFVLPAVTHAEAPPPGNREFAGTAAGWWSRRSG